MGVERGMMIRACVCVSAVLASCFCFAAPSADESILALYREAKQNNAAYLATLSAVEAELEGRNIALGQLLPSLSISGNYNRNETERTVSSVKDTFSYDSHAYTLNIRQPLYRKYNFSLFEQAKLQGEAAISRGLFAGNELAVNLVIAYFDVQYSADQQRLLQAQKLAVTEQLDAAKRAVAVGHGTRIDVDEAQARLEVLLAQEIELNNAGEHARRALQLMVNRELGKLPVLDVGRFQPEISLGNGYKDWVELGEKNNPEYAALLSQVDVARLEVEKSSAGHYPTLDFVASVGSSTNDSVNSLNRFSDTNYQTNSYGVQFTIPLFAGGQVSATVRQSAAKLTQARLQAEEFRRNLVVKIRREHDSFVQSITKINALQNAEASAERVVQSTKKGIAAGVRSTIDLLQAEQQFFTVKRDLAQARYVHLISRLRLKALVGEVEDADLEKISILMARY